MNIGDFMVVLLRRGNHKIIAVIPTTNTKRLNIHVNFVVHELHNAIYIYSLMYLRSAISIARLITNTRNVVMFSMVLGITNIFPLRSPVSNIL